MSYYIEALLLEARKENFTGAVSAVSMIFLKSSQHHSGEISFLVVAIKTVIAPVGKRKKIILCSCQWLCFF
jgi:hypothetical protein